MAYVINETPREAYDKIVEYFSRPDAVIAHDKGACVYRVGREPSGAACAVGCLIPDNDYDPAMDADPSLGLFNLVQRGMIGVRDQATLKFICEAQAAHDYTAFNVSSFLRELDVVAARNGIIEGNW